MHAILCINFIRFEVNNPRIIVLIWFHLKFSSNIFSILRSLVSFNFMWTWKLQLKPMAVRFEVQTMVQKFTSLNNKREQKNQTKLEQNARKWNRNAVSRCFKQFGFAVSLLSLILVAFYFCMQRCLSAQ